MNASNSNNCEIINMKLFNRLFIFILFITISSCGTSYKLKRDFNKSHKESEFFKGFVLYNPETRTQIINHNGSKLFTPASNTKLYTFYSAYKTLGDSLKGLEYYKSNDTLYIKGSADPSFLYGFEGSKTIPFLKNHKGSIVLLDASLDDTQFGNGWSWEDYQYYYMPERSLFPMYGNVFTYAMKGDSIAAHPSYFKKHVTVLDSTDMNREFEENQFYLERLDSTSNYTPFKTSTKLVAELLSDTLQKSVHVMSQKRDLDFMPFYSIAVDSVYKQMLVVSDNFIAEQLMLQVAKKTKDTYNVEDGIEYILENHLQNLPQKPVWRDGSGLSVYNLFSPEDTVFLLTKMYQEIPLEKLMDYLPVGGESGTLRNWYGGKDKPYVYAKSGTLSNTYCLSGYLITKKGTVLIFSYMNNNFNRSNSNIRREMQKQLSNIYETY
ncbi:MAG: D-alanyl-D-alanine carboxypeptidase [Flavobacteriaceae bacterium]|nr:D-alanyl-D-alanine carboxypeptidase [Flavobacteriaceae bacterium]